MRKGSYTFDIDGNYSNDKTSIIALDDLYLLGLLNSEAVDFFLKSISSTKQGGYFEYKPVYVSQLPIAQADEETKAGILALVEQVLAAKQADASADTDALEAAIDLQVYRLYNLTYDEVLLVEPGFAMPREEYEAALYLSN
ncbi:TaqI-like C-terminal specificity domain-containing protein [Pontibacter sp. BAB1700]|uniref:TaqI-like C-terminal specificity domain-containing protein n=1 Tax=Pontibacter sp. BAB1700 TaxID=1144253 RepID=UPI00026BD1B8|nr:hypothetical protein O71_06232 [Pontibacter sp. BAB1700]